MAKELIISANVHEKKVAMLEDGVVTEFYVERRDENQGVVGNLYKGRVMKVLPGMQSAFVDIGLERDAFLYVSDFTEFMEEEEEIDFREVTDEARVPPRVDDRSRRAERPRPEPRPSLATPAPATEPARDDEAPVERPVRIEDAVEQLAEIADESMIPPPPPEEELPELEPGEVQAAPVEAFPVERITDDDIAQVEPARKRSRVPLRLNLRSRRRGQSAVAQGNRSSPERKLPKPKKSRQGRRLGRPCQKRPQSVRAAGVRTNHRSKRAHSSFNVSPMKTCVRMRATFLRMRWSRRKSSNGSTMLSFRPRIFSLSPSLSGEWAVFALWRKAAQSFSVLWMRMPKPPHEKRRHGRAARLPMKRQAPLNRTPVDPHPFGTYPMWFAGSTDAYNPGLWAARRAI